MPALPSPLLARARTRALAIRKALGAPMTRIPMVADPGLVLPSADAAARTAREAIRYAAFIGQRDGLLPNDLDAIDGHLIGHGRVVFIQADAGQAEIATIEIPRHILEFDVARSVVEMPALPEPARCGATTDMLDSPAHRESSPVATEAPTPASESLPPPVATLPEPPAPPARIVAPKRAPPPARRPMPPCPVPPPVPMVHPHVWLGSGSVGVAISFG